MPPASRSNLPDAYVLLRDYLIENFNGRRASGGKEVVVRCPYCGDSRDLKDAHFYIGLNRKFNNAISCNCFRCPAGGIVGPEVLRKIGVYDTNIINAVVKYNSGIGANVWGSPIEGRNFYSRVANDSIIPIRESPEYLKKLAYINKRIGAELTLRDIQLYGVALNLLDYLHANRITTYSRHESIMQQLAFGYIGFVSADSTHVTLRRIVPEDKVHESIRTRYVNYTINENGTNAFCIREGINPSLPNVICIAEGAIDALSIHYNLRWWQMNKVVFAACGKDMWNVLQFIVYKKAFSFFNTVIHIYIDNDISPATLASYKQIPIKLGIPCVFHRNGAPNEKDFGVPFSSIQDIIL